MSVYKFFNYQHRHCPHVSTLVSDLLHISLIPEPLGVPESLRYQRVHLVQHYLRVEAAHLPADAEVAQETVECWQEGWAGSEDEGEMVESGAGDEPVARTLI